MTKNMARDREYEMVFMAYMSCKKRKNIDSTLKNVCTHISNPKRPSVHTQLKIYITKNLFKKANLST
jgi:hypothetical protein